MRYLFALLLSGIFLSTSAFAANPVVELVTSKGTIKIELYPDKSTTTVKNFLKYVDDGFYDGTIFHRVIPGFMIQGGGFKPKMEKKKTNAPIKNEAKTGLSNVRGTISMARTNDPDSATAQFFINVGDNSRSLDYNQGTGNAGYAAFGKVIDGMKVADAIVKAPRGSVGFYDDVPKEDILIKKARQVKK